MDYKKMWQELRGYLEDIDSEFIDRDAQILLDDIFEQITRLEQDGEDKNAVHRKGGHR